MIQNFAEISQAPQEWKNHLPLTDGFRQRHRNTILRHLPGQAIDRLRLRRVELPAGMLLERAEQEVHQVIFLEEGLASMNHAFKNGSQVEVGMFGNESVIGTAACMGFGQSANDICMQMSGSGYTARLADVCQEFSLGEHFQKAVLGYVQLQLLRANQSAACNAQHDLGQRLARWLMVAADRAGTHHLNFSQEFLSIALGVQRTSVAIIMGQLKRAGLVEYSRGRIKLLNVPGLKGLACECYHALDSYDSRSSDQAYPAALSA